MGCGGEGGARRRTRGGEIWSRKKIEVDLGDENNLAWRVVTAEKERPVKRK